MLVTIVVGVLIWRIPIMMRAPLDAARAYCGGDHVADVLYSRSTKMTKIVSSLLGGGATYHPAHGDSFTCPVVGPDAMSDACKAILDVTDWVSVCSVSGDALSDNGTAIIAGSDPLNATYTIDGESFTLVQGLYEKEVAPGSATKDVVSIFGVPVYGDLDDDGDDDALIFLRRMGGGSGTFYYVAAAIKTGEGFKGTNAILLGDRISPENISMRSGVALVNYADRAPSEPMTTQPSLGKTLYATLSNGAFVSVGDMPKGYAVFYGTLTLSGDAATFQPCGTVRPIYPVSSDSPFLSDISMMFGGESGTVYAVVVGQVTKETTIHVDRIVRLSSSLRCQSDVIVLDTPRPETIVTSPLHISGRARGNWFFEASFPVSLTDWDGRIIAQGVAEAKGDWMTEDFVPFEATVSFKTPVSGKGIPDTGSLILKKDNPSGLPEYDDALEITVRFR